MKKIGIIVVIIIIVIAIAIVVFNNILNTTTDETENIVENAETSSNEEDILVTEIDTPETDETWEWQHDTPENHNIDVSVLNSVHNTMDSYPINAGVIVKDGVIVDEYYKEGYNNESVFTLQSTSKSITSAIFGIAIDIGMNGFHLLIG